jgi:outer membrane protein TolC
MSRTSLVFTSVMTVLLAGCATVDVDQAIGQANEAASGFTAGRLEFSRTSEQRARASNLTEELLAAPLTQDGAVQLSLAYSPALQALLARNWAEQSAAAQMGRIPNPVFAFERLRVGDELEFGRLLSFGLLDLLTLPQRAVLARNQQAQVSTQLTSSVVEHVSQVRQAWVRAVAAQQMLGYARQVQQAGEASAELAKRMQQAGNFTRLQRVRQHAFYADATARLASAQHAATAAREELVRQLGLDDTQAHKLVLAERLPDLPAQPRAPADVSAAALQQRLDVQLARQQLEVAGRSQGLDLLNSLLDTEVGVRRDTVFDGGQRDNRRGYELEIRLPLFDWGNAQRSGLNAQSLAAANRYEAVTRSAGSQLRETYSAYRTALDVARHYRDEILPLRKTMAEENVLRYNGMLIGVFELLADTRDQIAGVSAAIDAQQQFWLADAALSAALIGKPLAAPATAAAAVDAPASAGAH